jgi:hypothetical protein
LKASIEGGCQDSIIKGVQINPLPTTCDFNIQRNWSVNSRNYVFTPTGGSTQGINYTWILGDGNKKTSVASGTDYTYKGNIKYCITMIASNAGGCECSTTKCITVNTSIDNNSAFSAFNVYPNPSDGIFTIQSEGQSEYTVQIFNSIGELILERTVTNSEEIFDLSSEASGVYTVKIVSTEGVATHKITITH